jgi:hypothetical protein
MEIQTRHRLKLLNSKCEYVCIVENLSKKLDYGDDIECCLNKLYLASKLINRLECYCFNNPDTLNCNCSGTVATNVNSEFFCNMDQKQYNFLFEVYYLTIQLNVNGTTYIIFSNDADKASKLIEDKLVELGVFVSATIDKDNLTVLYVLSCEVSEFDFDIQYGLEPTTNYVFSNTVVGVCPSITVVQHNCIEDSDLRQMYAVLDNLLS